MSNERKIIQGQGLPLPGNDIDTDRIIPARFMKCVTFDGLGEYAFYDERFDENKNQKDHPLNKEQYKKASILVVNKNFGCGSSREHAPQALQRYGFNAVIGESFAEIFAGNCTAMGIPTAMLPTEDIKAIMTALETQPGSEITIDVSNKTINLNNAVYNFNIPESSRLSLIEGTWDTTNTLLKNTDIIKAKVKDLPYINQYQ